MSRRHMPGKVRIGYGALPWAGPLALKTDILYPNTSNEGQRTVSGVPLYISLQAQLKER